MSRGWAGGRRDRVVMSRTRFSAWTARVCESAITRANLDCSAESSASLAARSCNTRLLCSSTTARVGLVKYPMDGVDALAMKVITIKIKINRRTVHIRGALWALHRLVTSWNAISLISSSPAWR